MPNKVRVRYAPSPTGFNHSGGIKTALYNYLFAKKMNGEFYVRIEDTDHKRFNSQAVDYIKDSLEWCGIISDDAPWNPNPKYGEYFQSKRDYSTHIKYLLDNDFAYLAFDTEEDLDLKKISYSAKNRHLFKNSISLSKEDVDSLLANNTPCVVRIKIPENKEIILNDLIRGIIKFNTNDIDDKVLVKSNGIPTYHLAHVVDDYLMETSHIIRGDEWIPSAAIHLLLWEFFSWKKPQYAHLSLLLNPDGKGKLSKRTAFKNGFEIFPLPCSDIDEKGDIVSFKGFKGLGYESISYVNFLALLGFNFGKDVLTMEEMIANFDLTKVSSSPAVFDVKKSLFINREHMLKINNEILWEDYNFSSIYDHITKDVIMTLAKERANFRHELKFTLDIFFEHIKTKEISDDTKKIISLFLNTYPIFKKEDMKMTDKEFKEYQETLAAFADVWDYNDLTYDDFKNWIDVSHINKKELREVLCGGKSGPELPRVAEIIGIHEFKRRFERYI